MRVVYEKQFSTALKSVSDYIAKDKLSASVAFKKELKKKFEVVMDNPRMYRASFYFDDEHYRDLTYMGHTVIYKIDTNVIRVLDIFKWEDR